MSKTRLGLSCLLSVAACTSEPLSVGQPPCEAGEARCETLEQVFLDPQSPARKEVSGQSQVEWQRLLTPTECLPENCEMQSKFVVHDTGEVTVAALLTRSEPATRRRTSLWVAWLDADGQSLWENDELSLFPERGSEMQSACLSDAPCGPVVTSFALGVTPDGGVIALVGSDPRTLEEGDPPGRLDGYAIERAGRVAPEMMIDSLDRTPQITALALDDVIITDSSGLFTRYSARGELLWRRSDAVARPPDEWKILTPDPNNYLLQIATDSLGRVWALVYEDTMLGFLRLEPTGRPGWRAWAWMTYHAGCDFPFPPGSGGAEWVFDSQQRPVIATSPLGVLRLEPEAEVPAEKRASLSSPTQEEFYSPCDVFGLDTDAQDRVYVATHEGPRSDERLRIDRISSDFHKRERYIPDLGDVVWPGETLRGLQVTPGGDVYVLIQELGLGGQGPIDEPHRIQLARLQLSAPDAPSAGAAAR